MKELRYAIKEKSVSEVKIRKRLPVITIVLAIFSFSGCSSGSWRDASRQSANIAPSPESASEAVYRYMGQTHGVGAEYSRFIRGLR